MDMVRCGDCHATQPIMSQSPPTPTPTPPHLLGLCYVKIKSTAICNYSTTCDQHVCLNLAPLYSAKIELSIHAKNPIRIDEKSTFPGADHIIMLLFIMIIVHTRSDVIGTPTYL